MFFGKKSKEPKLPEPFGAEGSFGSADNEPPETPAMPPLKMDEIKKAVTMPALKPPIPPPKMDAPPQAPPAAPPFSMQAPPQRAPQAQPASPPRAFPPSPSAQPPQAFPFQTPQPPQRGPPMQTARQPQTSPFQATPAQPQKPQFPMQPAQAFQNPRAPPPGTLQPPRLQPLAQKRQEPPKPADAEIPEEGSPFAPDNFETPAAGKKTGIGENDEEAPSEHGEETPEPEFHPYEKPAPKAEKKEKAAVPRILPPPPPPHMETPETDFEKEEGHAKHKQKKETLIEGSQPELLRALVELVNKSSTVPVVEALKDNELSLAELVNKTGIDENDLKDVLHRFTCLGLVKEFWYKSPAGNHIRKYKLEATKGSVEFDLLALKDTLPIEELKAKSTRLVALITAGGRMPKSVLLKALPVMDEEQLEQVIRYTEKFKLPSIRDMLTVEATISLDAKPAKQEEAEGEEKPPEVTDLYYEIENIQKSLGELE